MEKLLGISKLVVDSFCALYIRHLKCIMCNRFSGHIVNAFLESPLSESQDVNKIVKILTVSFLFFKLCYLCAVVCRKKKITSPPYLLFVANMAVIRSNVFGTMSALN